MRRRELVLHRLYRGAFCLEKNVAKMCFEVWRRYSMRNFLIRFCFSQYASCRFHLNESRRIRLTHVMLCTINEQVFYITFFVASLFSVKRRSNCLHIIVINFFTNDCRLKRAYLYHPKGVFYEPVQGQNGLKPSHRVVLWAGSGPKWFKMVS